MAGHYGAQYQRARPARPPVRLIFNRHGWWKLERTSVGALICGPFPTAEAAYFLQGFTVAV